MSAHTPGPWIVEGGQQSWSREKGTIETVLGGDCATVVASPGESPAPVLASAANHAL